MLAHCTSVLADHAQFEAVVRLNAKLPALDETCPGSPEVLALHVDGVGDGEGVGEGEGEGAVGEDGVPLFPSLHAVIRNSNTKGRRRLEADRIMVRYFMHEFGHLDLRTRLTHNSSELKPLSSFFLHARRCRPWETVNGLVTIWANSLQIVYVCSGRSRTRTANAS
jgi:hypothetical protein